MPANVVTSNNTGAVYKYGFSDFTGQFNPADFTQILLNDSAALISGLPLYYHKVVAGDLVEQTAPEKTATDTERSEIRIDRLKGAVKITLFAPNLAALPLPPPGIGFVGACNDIGGGTPGLVVSSATGYYLFASTGFHS